MTYDLQKVAEIFTAQWRTTNNILALSFPTFAKISDLYTKCQQVKEKLFQILLEFANSVVVDI